jgi:hypothetical protein
MRNLKIFNHWIAELRNIARRNKVCNYDEDTQESIPMTEDAIKQVFSKLIYDESFSSGDTPQEAFDFTMQMWDDAIKELQK